MKTEDSNNYVIDDYNIFKLAKNIKYEAPNCIILFWNIYNMNSWLLLIYCKCKKIKIIYWSHGMSLQDPNNKLKKLIYNTFQLFSDSILLYSPNEMKYIPTCLHSKTFIANNTINFDEIPQIEVSKSDIKKEFNLGYDKIVLFVGRIQKRKRLDILLDIFKNRKDSNIGLVIVGSGFSEDYQRMVKNNYNIEYLGEIYDKIKINMLFKCADIFCIPGTNGLGVNQAMYWGLPVLALNVNHSPEIYYLKNGVNGYIVNSSKELENKMFSILNDENQLKKLSENAYKIIRKEASVNNMFNGFMNSINFFKTTI
ncbi:glycosyltransferase family 4 protein [Galbibacter sp. PAP.153]|uniref:glycosyltransferase family 4 protein n=1 Tax=Galbibacter sp. PAP.153 TaxID=3104623 RepID=UPI003008EE7B